MKLYLSMEENTVVADEPPLTLEIMNYDGRLENMLLDTGDGIKITIAADDQVLEHIGAYIHDDDGNRYTAAEFIEIWEKRDAEQSGVQT